jgi:hypothetical protein
LIPILEAATEWACGDNFQLAPAAVDVVAVQCDGASCGYPSAALNWAAAAAAQARKAQVADDGPQLVMRKTFWDLPEDEKSGLVDEQGRPKRAMSESTGRTLMETGVISKVFFRQSSGSVETSASTGEDGPSECCTVEIEQIQRPELQHMSPMMRPDCLLVPALAAEEYTWMPSSQSADLHWEEPYWSGSKQEVAPHSGPAGISHLFGTMSEEERHYNRSLWS